VIAEVGLREQPDCQPMGRACHALDRIAGPQVPRFDDAQIGAGATRGREALQEHRVAHSQAELEAGEPGLADLQQRRPDPPALADDRVRQIDSRESQVLAEVAGLQLATQPLLPPERVLPSVRVHRLVDPAMHRAIGLLVAGEVHPADRHAALDGGLPDSRRDGSVAQIDGANAADVHG
jgi:hypothetical protein